MLKLILALIFATCIPVLSQEKQSSYHSACPIPQWVNTHEFPLEALPIKASQVNYQLLLLDTQINWEEKTTYFHQAFKVLTYPGIRDNSRLEIEYDPSYQDIKVHVLRVYRAGQWIDQLETCRYQIMQRETDLDRSLYRGSLSLIFFLDDIRIGDIIEYAYCRTGVNPLFATHFSDAIFLQKAFSVERLFYRLLADPKNSFFIKSLNTSIEPSIKDLSSNLREWSWEAFETIPCPKESNEPGWYFPISCVYLTQHETWQSVAEKEATFYPLEEDFHHTAPKEILNLIEKWKDVTSDLQEQALLAIRFVQDEVRYFGFEEGIKGSKPSDPWSVFQRRYGDCKEKSMLLCALLKLMDIRSTPILVHTERGKLLPDLIPSTILFNHVVLQIEIQGIYFYVDPTIGLQGGALNDVFFPNYHWGLPVSKNASGLIPLPTHTLEKPTEINSTYELISIDTAKMKIEYTYFGRGADRGRTFIKAKGDEKFTKEYFADIQKKLGRVELTAPIQIRDDREKNILTVSGECTFQTRKRGNKRVLEPISFIITDYLDNKINPARPSPYSLAFPLWVKEHIHIENPIGNWAEDLDDFKYQHESFELSYSMKREQKSADFDFELRHLKDHVSALAIEGYWNITNEIKDIPLDLIITSGKEQK